jgi:pimeloyl-ACP methyl ester carboxylesterase
LVIRGANSDILSPTTIGEMRAHHSDLEVIEIADQGHVPFFDAPGLIDRIAAFIRRCETAVRPGAKS